MIMKVTAASLAGLYIMLTTTSDALGASLAPDLAIVNASVHTMDAGHPRAQAVAVIGNRIAAVGRSADIRALAGAGTRVIDARGKLLLPGFNDAHVHFLMGGFSLSSVDLRAG